MRNLTNVKSLSVLLIVATKIAIAQQVLPYAPITPAERWQEFKRDSFTSPDGYLVPLFPAGIAHLKNKPTQWGQGAEGFGRRAGYAYATNFMDDSILHASAAILKNDVRYEASKDSKVLLRLRHAISRTFVTRAHDGRLTFNASNFMSSYGAGMLATYMLPSESYEPLKYGVRQGHVLIAAHAGSNLLKEFTPEIKKLFHRK